ncbi:DUF4097 domain-containing protein [Fulvivirga maritima]|uniref:DUF4097 family beta strand repeat-containing protein n=1 Tax=Fulvivirga maritima TaxID=2904247 RepID=UPI001F2D1092|nr:DUF4097 family beta strand repeat-containing protein [Fulvivirga maritima]UII24964.1 DUF4097 domain-containing protein [Fulvivirga maritima]
MMSRILGILMLILLSCTMLFSQQKLVHVVTKTIERELKQDEVKKMKINSEKADINVVGWSGNSVKLTIKLVAKNKSKEDAESDLQFIKYQITKKEDAYIVSNVFYSKDNRTAISSDLSVVYELKVPKTMGIYITNMYGGVSVAHLSGYLDVQLKFGQIELGDLSGELKINTYYGDLMARNLKVKMRCVSEKSNVELSGIEGAYYLEANFGTLSFQGKEGLTFLQVEAKNSEVSLNLDSFEEYRYDLSTLYGNIKIPERYQEEVKKSISQKRSFNQTFRSDRDILIHTTFNDIKISSIKTISSSK